MGEWIEHDGKSMPVPGNALVLTRRRDSERDTGIPWTAEQWGGDDDPEQSNWFECGDDTICEYIVVGYEPA